MLNTISEGKGLYKVVKGFRLSMIDIHFDLGNHNVLLETNYDLWA